MAQATTLQLLPQTTAPGTGVTGTAQKAASYYRAGKTMQTVTWSFTTVQATMYIEASLADNPTSNNDWFVVYTLATGGTLTQNSFTNIEGNYVWIRCRIDPFTSGVIQNIKVTY
jgi:hypothetical protein